MKNKNTQILKRIAMLITVCALVITSVLTPMSASAAAKKPKALNKYVMAKGEKWTFTIYDTAAKAKITYKTSNKKIATVNKKGLITAKKKGSANITATIKQGKKTYQAKIKITVKTKLTPYEGVARGNAELIFIYNYCYNLAKTNGWLDNQDAVDYLNACYDVVEASDLITQNPGDYSDEDIVAELEAIIAMTSTMEDLIPVLAQPNS